MTTYSARYDGEGFLFQLIPVTELYEKLPAGTCLDEQETEKQAAGTAIFRTQEGKKLILTMDRQGVTS